ncbi:MAG: Fur family transcriptional regulator [Ardenticatenaceae bacterium]
MELDVERLLEALRASGRPVTPQRLRVWEALHVERDHPTAAELHLRCPDLPLATVYNTLELFTELNLVRPLTLAGVVRYDVDTSEHVNVICTHCGSVTDVTLTLPRAMQVWVGLESGFQLKYPRVDWYGLCPDCQLRI